jgi:hypothetical protein
LRDSFYEYCLPERIAPEGKFRACRGSADCGVLASMQDWGGAFSTGERYLASQQAACPAKDQQYALSRAVLQDSTRYAFLGIIDSVSWQAYFHPKFKAEFDELPESVQDELLASLTPLRVYGPALGRPEVDTLKGSAYANMKELRFRAGGGVWRVAFAFDPTRAAILLVAGDKSGVSEKKFYKRLIEKADLRYKEHLGSLK